MNFKAKKIADKLGYKQALRRVAMVAAVGKEQKTKCSTKDRVQ